MSYVRVERYVLAFQPPTHTLKQWETKTLQARPQRVFGCQRMLIMGKRVQEMLTVDKATFANTLDGEKYFARDEDGYEIRESRRGLRFGEYETGGMFMSVPAYGIIEVTFTNVGDESVEVTPMLIGNAALTS